jgi:hypothetical protein
LVVADETIESPELRRELERRASREDVRVFLLAPTPVHRRRAARERVDRVVQCLRSAGLAATGDVGDGIAVIAVAEAWDPGLYDEVIVCTFPEQLSKWLEVALPERIAQLTGASVSHVIARRARVTVRLP